MTSPPAAPATPFVPSPRSTEKKSKSGASSRMSISPESPPFWTGPRTSAVRRDSLGGASSPSPSGAAVSDGRLPKLFWMIDGEFTGPNWETHATVAWGITVFRGTGRAPQTREDLHTRSIVDTFEVRLALPDGCSWCPSTYDEFWAKRPELYSWVRQPDKLLPPEVAMEQCVRFLLGHTERAYLVGVAKPSATDLGRFQHMVFRHIQDAVLCDEFCRRVPLHNTRCLLTMMVSAQQALRLDRVTLLRRLYRNRELLGYGGEQDHRPVRDTLVQVCDFLYLRAQLRQVLQERRDPGARYRAADADPAGTVSAARSKPDEAPYRGYYVGYDSSKAGGHRDGWSIMPHRAAPISGTVFYPSPNARPTLPPPTASLWGRAVGSDGNAGAQRDWSVLRSGHATASSKKT